MLYLSFPRLIFRFVNTFLVCLRKFLCEIIIGTGKESWDCSNTKPFCCGRMGKECATDATQIILYCCFSSRVFFSRCYFGSHLWNRFEHCRYCYCCCCWCWCYYIGCVDIQRWCWWKKCSVAIFFRKTVAVSVFMSMQTIKWNLYLGGDLRSLESFYNDIFFSFFYCVRIFLRTFITFISLYFMVILHQLEWKWTFHSVTIEYKENLNEKICQ